MPSMSARNKRRRGNYEQLRNAGFTVKHSNIFKDYSRANIKELCTFKELQTKQFNEFLDDLKKSVKQ